MNDLISRQAAIEAVGFYSLHSGNKLLFADKPLKALPSAQPERKVGKWIPHSEKSREYIETALVNVSYDYWVCDTCGYRVENGQPMYNFCPKCGAYMKERRDDAEIH